MRIDLNWSEPLAMKRHRLAKVDPWWPNRVVKALGIAAVCAIAYAAYDAFARRQGGPGSANYWLGMLFAALAGGAFLGLLRPWASSLMESQIVISRRGINRNDVLFSPAGVRAEFWPWSEIGELSVERVSLENESLCALVLRNRQGKVLGTIGVGPQTTVAIIASAVAAYDSSVRIDDPT